MPQMCNTPTSMTVEDCRRFYAEEVQLLAGFTNPALYHAFATVKRENFLGPGPWEVGTSDMSTGAVRYVTTKDADPCRVYHNVPIALDKSRDLNNGQPASVGYWINNLDLQPGDRVFHLGCGVGYFTAIMAEAASRNGHVAAIEVDGVLAERAEKNLSPWPNVRVHAGDGGKFDPGECDAIFVNAGVTHPLPLWLDRLAPGGRIVLPLTVPMVSNLGKGLMVRIARETNGYSAKFIGYTAIYTCTSVRDPQIEPLLLKAMSTGTMMRIKALRRDQHEAAETCSVHAADFCLSMADLPATS